MQKTIIENIKNDATINGSNEMDGWSRQLDCIVLEKFAFFLSDLEQLFKLK